MLLLGCAGERRTEIESGGQPSPAASAQPRIVDGKLQARCTVAPECPREARTGELTSSRSSHTWTIENGTAEPRDFVVVLEIADDLGHSKKKEVPGRIAAHSKLDDSTSIALTTTYRQTGAVAIEAKTTVRFGEEALAADAQSCRFELP
jgi:hypothetical protein